MGAHVCHVCVLRQTTDWSTDIYASPYFAQPYQYFFPMAASIIFNYLGAQRDLFIICYYVMVTLQKMELSQFLRKIHSKIAHCI